MIGATRHRNLSLAFDWNTVVTVQRGSYQRARDILAPLGDVRPTGFYNVLAMQVPSPRGLLERVRDLALARPGDVYPTISHLAPVTEQFGFADEQDLAARTEQAARGWLPELAGKRFQVRMHRRGARGEIHGGAEEAELVEALSRALLARGELAGGDADDPDIVIDVETLGWEAGIALWTREELSTYPLLEAGLGLARPNEADLWQERRTMVQEQVRGRGLADPRLLHAMQSIPRHAFLAPRLRAVSYLDCALGVGNGRTAPAPRIVARSLDALELKGDERVLQIGAGCGYQTALLAWLASEVVAVEADSVLAEQVGRRLARLGLTNVTVIAADGTDGYRPRAPYDAIAVNVGLQRLSAALAPQLADGGRLVAPVGERPFQRLLRLQRNGDALASTDCGPCVFAPLRPSIS